MHCLVYFCPFVLWAYHTVLCAAVHALLGAITIKHKYTKTPKCDSFRSVTFHIHVTQQSANVMESSRSVGLEVHDWIT